MGAGLWHANTAERAESGAPFYGRNPDVIATQSHTPSPSHTYTHYSLIVQSAVTLLCVRACVHSGCFITVTFPNKVIKFLWRLTVLAMLTEALNSTFLCDHTPSCRCSHLVDVTRLCGDTRDAFSPENKMNTDHRLTGDVETLHFSADIVKKKCFSKMVSVC